MGYSEVPCRLCGVSFNIGRIRRPGEPQSEGWTSSGDGRWFAEDTGYCSVEDGCWFVARKIDSVKKDVRAENVVCPEEEDEEDDDSDYVDESMDDEEYEFESDDELVGDSNKGCEDVEVKDDTQGQAWLRYLTGDDVSDQIQETPEQEKLLPLTFLDDFWQPKEDDHDREQDYDFDTTDFEHVAGPNCKNHLGCNGHLITAEEMKGCDTLQCLVPKDRWWKSEPDDQDFERQSNYFLSGLSDELPSHDDAFPDVIPVRHGQKSVNAEFVPWDGKDDEFSAMPFHTTCFDIFTRLSRLRFGRVDINGLMGWYHLEWDQDSAYGFPYGADVDRIPEPGLEYLAANPLFVPRLSSILRSVIHKEPSFSAQAGAFALPNLSCSRQSSRNPSRSPVGVSQDVFVTLPQELKLEIISYLGSSDIASLRLATRAFRQLPIFLWRRLLQEEMPWLWEVWSDNTPHIWATVSVAALKEEMVAKKAIEKELEILRAVIKEEMPEMLDAWIDAERSLLAARPDPIVESQATALKTLICTLPTANTNWYQLYSDITRHWSDLKGLHNRRRIWTAVEEIISRIRRYREEGKIVD